MRQLVLNCMLHDKPFKGHFLRGCWHKPAACPLLVSLVQETQTPRASCDDWYDGLSLPGLLWVQCGIGWLGQPFLLCAQLSYASLLQGPYIALSPLQTQHDSACLIAQANKYSPEVLALWAAAS